MWRRLRQLDPGLRATHQAVRVTVAACCGFYAGRYVLGQPAIATYALFTAIALGALSQIPGSALQRARTIVIALPLGWLLVTAGTLLAVSNLAASVGMFVLGFLVSFAGVGGPRLVGLVNGQQLLYILPCFPPYDPGSLWLRLIGVTVGALLLSLAEIALWPEPAPRPYRAILGTAVGALAECLVTVAEYLDAATRRPVLDERITTMKAAADRLRPSKLDPIQRPVAAVRSDKALAQASDCVRYVTGRIAQLARESPEQLGTPAAAALVRATAVQAGITQRWLLGSGPAPDPGAVRTATTAFEAARDSVDPSGVHPDRLRRGALALSIADGMYVLVMATRLATRAPVPTEALTTGPFWYAALPAWRLVWHRVRLHLTPHSVYLQGALRLALALAVARFIAGTLDLSHGFWVLLAILTTMRASVAQTRAQLGPALLGTAVGAIVAGVVLAAIGTADVFAVALPFVMVAGLAAGPLLGQVWGQSLFTLVIALVFAQIGPKEWELAEARIIDVVIGMLIGVAVGLLAWPRGGAGELHRATGRFLVAAGSLVSETVAVLTGRASDAPALPEVRHRDAFADASFAQFASDPTYRASSIDWQATMLAGRDALRGAEHLLTVRPEPVRSLASSAGPLQQEARSVSGAYVMAGTQLTDGAAVAVASGRIAADEWPTNLGRDLYRIADLRVWLDGLDDALTHIAVGADRG